MGLNLYARHICHELYLKWKKFKAAKILCSRRLGFIKCHFFIHSKFWLFSDTLPPLHNVIYFTVFFFLKSSLIKIERRILEISLKRRYIEEAPFAKSERPCQLSIWKAFQKGPIRSCASLIMYFLGWILMETKEERWILEKRDCCKGRAKFPNADQSRSTWANLHGVPKICFHGQVFLSFKLWWVQPRYRSALEPKKRKFWFMK